MAAEARSPDSDDAIDVTFASRSWKPTSAALLLSWAVLGGRVMVFHRFARVDGLRLFYREAGDPQHPHLLLLHGFPTSSHMFRNLIPPGRSPRVFFRLRLTQIADSGRTNRWRVPRRFAEVLDWATVPGPIR